MNIAEISEHAFADMNITANLLKWALQGLNDTAIQELTNTIELLATSTDLAYIMLKLAYANQRYIKVTFMGSTVRVSYNSKILFQYDNMYRVPA